MPRQHTTNNKTYRDNRRRLLADNPLCVWCQTNVATEADHLVPYDAGGSDDLDNLAPACKPCNASRGAKYGNKKRAQIVEPTPATTTKRGGKTPAKTEHVYEKPSEILLSSSGLPPHASNLLSQKPLSVVGTGHDRPRLETITPDWAESRADEIVGFARDVLGVDLYPWQVVVCHGVTAMDPETGDYLRRIGYTSVARQNGKTQVMAAIIGHFLMVEAPRRGTPQVVMSVAHKLDLAVALFKYLAPILEAKAGAKVSWSYGRNELEIGGHRWLIRAATPQAGHGYSVDLLTIDETWSVSEAAIDEGLLPTQRARKNPLCLMFSTAGTENSTAMIRWRSQGLRQIDAGEVGPMWFGEWSPPSNVDPMTSEAWEFANPSLGYGGLTMDVLEAESKAPNRQAFLRASCNIFVASANGWLEPGLFDGLRTDAPLPPGGVLSVDHSVEAGLYVGVRAAQAGAGVVATVAFQVASLGAAWAAVEAAMAGDAGLLLTIPPTMEISCPKKWERRRTVVGFRELNRWTAPVRQMIIEGQLSHSGELSLVEHVERAVMVKYQGSVTLSSNRSPGDITLARCLVFAAALAARPANRQKPQLVVVGK